jgi:FkbM family methyltransferase
MPLSLLRRAARLLLPAQPAGPLPRPSATLAAPLAALGATALPAEARSLGGRSHLRATLDATAPDGLAAILVTATVASGPARLRLSAPDGTAHDTLELQPEPTPHHAWLYAPPGPLQIDLQALHPSTRLRLHEAAAWHLPPAALDLAALIPAPPLVPDATWPRAYGPPPPHDAPARLREHLFAGLRAPVLVPLLGSLKLWLEPGDELSRAALLSGLYEPETLLAVEALLPVGGTFADVGANCGLITAFAARRAARVLAFEPSPREFARLQANLEANAVAHATPIQAALAEAPGTVTLRLAEAGHAGHNTIGTGFAYQGVATDTLHEVPATTLDSALASLDRCDLIKMDIEGAELRALHGAGKVLARLRPALILEVFDQALAGCGATEAELLSWLESQGYDTFELDPATATWPNRAAARPGTSRNIIAMPR